MPRNKRRMSPTQFAQWLALQAKDQDTYTHADWDMYCSLRDGYVLPPRTDVEPGTLATFHIGSDRYAGRITRVETGARTVWFANKGAPDDSAEPFTYRPSSGRYLSKGQNCGALGFGYANDYWAPEV